MKAYKFEVVVIDFENCGVETLQIELEDSPNCSSQVISTVEADIGDWYDTHPLNGKVTTQEIYKQLFGGDDES